MIEVEPALQAKLAFTLTSMAVHKETCRKYNILFLSFLKVIILIKIW